VVVAQAAGTTGRPCEPIDGTAHGSAHALPAGTYRLCASVMPGYGLDGYDLAITVLP
jgi:hypothetical protein